MNKSFLRLLLSALLSIWFCNSVHAQSTTVYINGVPLICRDSRGAAVPVYWTEDAIRLGGGAFAQIRPDSGPSILLSETYYRKLSRLGAFMVFFHECAHLALPMGVGLGTPLQERNADCYAVSEMQRRGLINSWKEFESSMSALEQANSHIPTKDRVEQAAQCLRVVKVATDDPICQIIDEVFSRGWAWTKSRADAKLEIIEGYNCTADRDILDCTSKTFENDDEIDENRARLSAKISRCLPVFEHRDAYRGHFWTNRQLGKEVMLGMKGQRAISFHFNR